MFSAAWFTVVKRPFASRVTIARTPIHQVSVAGFGTRQRLLGAFGLVISEGWATVPMICRACGRARSRPPRPRSFARAVIDDPGLVGCTSRRAPCLRVRRRGDVGRRHVVGDRLPRRHRPGPAEHFRASLVRGRTRRSVPVTTTASGRAATTSAAPAASRPADFWLPQSCPGSRSARRDELYSRVIRASMEKRINCRLSSATCVTFSGVSPLPLDAVFDDLERIGSDAHRRTWHAPRATSVRADRSSRSSRAPQCFFLRFSARPPSTA